MTQTEREVLIEACIPIVTMHARRLSKLCRNAGPVLDGDDLFQEGCIGLIKAADIFDPSRGVQFKTYADRKISGAMIDKIRGSTHYRKGQIRRVSFVSLFAEPGEIALDPSDNGIQAKQIDTACITHNLMERSKLSVRDRSIVTDRFGHDRDFLDLSNQYGLSVTELRQITTRGIRLLSISYLHVNDFIVTKYLSSRLARR